METVICICVISMSYTGALVAVEASWHLLAGSDLVDYPQDYPHDFLSSAARTAASVPITRARTGVPR